MSKLKILELFGGIGACSKALEKLKIDYEIVDYVEIDKYAVKSFNAIHNTNFEPQDICEWDKDIDIDLIMHGSPCQDFSLAGKQAGGDKDSGTRSSLMYETVRIVKKLKPKYVIWENVKNLLSNKHRHNFNAYLEIMENMGYKNYYQVLNAKDYGIPQNRERVFTVSILGNENYKFPQKQECNNQINRLCGLYNQVTRWGIYDKDGLAPTLTAAMGCGGGHVPMIENGFNLPSKQELKLKLKDILEDEVDEKYYLSEKMIKYISSNGTKGFENNNCKINLDIGRLLTTSQNKRADTTNYFSNTLPDNFDLNNEFINKLLNDKHIDIKEIKDILRIRKLTPKECWRLMGFEDADFEKASKVNSDTQLYKQAGNSIVVNVLESILKNLLINHEE